MGNMGSIPGQGTGISHALQCSQERKKKKKDMDHLDGLSFVLAVQISEKLTMVVVV